MLKDAKPHQLLNAIFDVKGGGLPLSPSQVGRILGYLKGEKIIPKPTATAVDVLSKGEKEVLECLKCAWIGSKANFRRAVYSK